MCPITQISFAFIQQQTEGEGASSTQPKTPSLIPDANAKHCCQKEPLMLAKPAPESDLAQQQNSLIFEWLHKTTALQGPLPGMASLSLTHSSN